MKTKTYLLGMFLISAVSGMGCDSIMMSEQAPTLDVIQADVFDVACATSGCHDAATQAGQLDLSSADASYSALVMAPVMNEVASENGWVRVRPYEPELSFLVRKIQQPGIGEGAPMPMGKYELTDYYVDLVATWIAGGAER